MPLITILESLQDAGADLEVADGAPADRANRSCERRGDEWRHSAPAAVAVATRAVDRLIGGARLEDEWILRQPKYLEGARHRIGRTIGARSLLLGANGAGAWPEGVEFKAGAVEARLAHAAREA